MNRLLPLLLLVCSHSAVLQGQAQPAAPREASSPEFPEITVPMDWLAQRLGRVVARWTRGRSHAAEQLL